MKKAITLAILASMLVTGCDNKEYIAQVGDKKISTVEYESYLKFKRIPMQDKERYSKVLEQFIEREALAQAIESSDHTDKQLLEAELNEFKRQMLINRYFETFQKESVTDDAIRNYYANHTDQFQTKKVHVAHILLRIDPKMDDSQRQARLTEAHEIYSKLQAGADFAEIAKQLSEDKVSAVKGGDLGWLKEGAVAPQFSEKAFVLKENEISEPIRTTFGFHIMKVLEQPKVITQPLESVKSDIQYRLRSEAKQAEIERLLQKVSYGVSE